MILCNDESSANDIVADLHVLPASHLTFKDCKNVFAYLNSTKYVTLSPLCAYLFDNVYYHIIWGVFQCTHSALLSPCRGTSMVCLLHSSLFESRLGRNIRFMSVTII